MESNKVLNTNKIKGNAANTSSFCQEEGNSNQSTVTFLKGGANLETVGFIKSVPIDTELRGSELSTTARARARNTDSSFGRIRAQHAVTASGVSEVSGVSQLTETSIAIRNDAAVSELQLQQGPQPSRRVNSNQNDSQDAVWAGSIRKKSRPKEEMTIDDNEVITRLRRLPPRSTPTQQKNQQEKSTIENLGIHTRKDRPNSDRID